MYISGALIKEIVSKEKWPVMSKARDSVVIMELFLKGGIYLLHGALLTLCTYLEGRKNVQGIGTNWRPVVGT